MTRAYYRRPKRGINWTFWWGLAITILIFAAVGMCN